MTKKKLFLLDALALLYRAHFAFIKNPRVTSTGKNTSAVFGFANSLLEILQKEKPTHIGVAFDSAGPTERHTAFEEYKAHREEMPEDLVFALPIAKRFLNAMQIPVFEVSGYEADDLIGTLALEAAKADFEVYMMTPDKDYAQLVRDSIFIYKPAAYGNGPEILNAEKVIEKFGVTPDKIIDFLALKGDASDNIPGIPKIGDKTAIELINQFGTLEEIIKNVDLITKNAVRESIKNNIDQGLLSKQLATIITNAPVELKEEELICKTPDSELLKELFKELEFKTMYSRVFGQTEINEGLFAKEELKLQSADNKLETTDTGFSKISDEQKSNYHILTSDIEIKELIAKLSAVSAFCFDTETESLDSLNSAICGLALSYEKGKGYYIPFGTDRSEAINKLEPFKGVFSNSNILKIAQNIKFDIQILEQYNLKISEPVFDTMLAHYILEPDSKHNMDFLSEKFLFYTPVSITELIGKKGKNQLTMRDISIEEVAPYACEDADITYQLGQIFIDKLNNDFKLKSVFETIEMPLVQVLSDMEKEGIKVDENALKDFSKELERDIKLLETEIYSIAGTEFNINSPKQLGEIIFEKLKLEKGKKTSTGQYSTNEAVLTQLAYSHEMPQKILDYRQLQKLKSTYVDTLPLLIDKKTGRVHTTFAQAVASTGRLSSNNPNLQNIPIKTEKGREVRKAFVAKDENHVLLSADYSQIELRIMAELSQDPNMISAFKNEEDIHKATASKVFGVPLIHVTPEMRNKAKMVNFGIIYGISAFGLAQRLKISRTEAKSIIDNYFLNYPLVKKYMDDCILNARANGFVETVCGRRRYLPDIHSANATIRGFAERNAINSPIQGTAADMIKIAMIRIHDRIKKEQLQSKMILQVHDELLFDAFKPETDQLKKLVLEEMSMALPFNVPLVAAAGTGQNWLDAH